MLVSQAGKLAVERGWAINVGECQGLGVGGGRPVPPSGMEFCLKILQGAPQSSLCMLPVMGSSLLQEACALLCTALHGAETGRVSEAPLKGAIGLLGPWTACSVLVVSWLGAGPGPILFHSQGPWGPASPVPWTLPQDWLMGGLHPRSSWSQQGPHGSSACEVSVQPPV